MPGGHSSASDWSNIDLNDHGAGESRNPFSSVFSCPAGTTDEVAAIRANPRRSGSIDQAAAAASSREATAQTHRCPIAETVSDDQKSSRRRSRGAHPAGIACYGAGLRAASILRSPLGALGRILRDDRPPRQRWSLRWPRLAPSRWRPRALRLRLCCDGSNASVSLAPSDVVILATWMILVVAVDLLGHVIVGEPWPSHQTADEHGRWARSVFRRRIDRYRQDSPSRPSCCRRQPPRTAASWRRAFDLVRHRDQFCIYAILRSRPSAAHAKSVLSLMRHPMHPAASIHARRICRPSGAGYFAPGARDEFLLWLESVTVVPPAWFA